MPRLLVKGGIWRNTEDEVLKAAVRRYGKNHWSRIASLFQTKSAEQCKTRWYESLDPSIKRTQWSREEEEKLLDLAEAMPLQWKIIASSIGRTITQCIEHYEYLLVQAVRKEDCNVIQNPNPESKSEENNINSEDESSDTNQSDMGKNEMQKLSEAKARFADLQAKKSLELKLEEVRHLNAQQELKRTEMQKLSEAKARLADIQGKRAKRKSLELRLEEARRLTAHKKQEEVKMAGIQLNTRKEKPLEFDYKTEVSVKRSPIPGLYDTSVYL